MHPADDARRSAVDDDPGLSARPTMATDARGGLEARRTGRPSPRTTPSTTGRRRERISDDHRR
ncbi:hypothetical protein [Halovalidus salilacus]|uniref:hypothetical protein n=1 Tax=Halovalidus salilacus TaxID=3075124 RepID=UPI0036077145